MSAAHPAHVPGAMTPFRARLGEHAARDEVPAIAMPGRSLGFPELVRRVDACAARLVRGGCAPGDIVGLTVADEVDHLVASLALASLGLPQVTLASNAPVDMRAGLARRLGVSRVVVANPAHALPGIEHVAGAGVDPGDLSRSAPAVPLGEAARSPLFLFTSSGTTGRAKVFGWDEAMVDWRARMIRKSEGGDARQRMLVSQSVENRAAQARRLYAAWLGVTSILREPSNRLTVGALCAAMDATHLELTALEAISLAQDDATPLPGGTIVHASGTRIPSALRRRFRVRHGLPLHVHYGTSEFGRIASTLGSGGGPCVRDDDSVGWPVPQIEVEVVDAGGHPVEAGEVGELRVRADRMIAGYHDDPEATARHFRDGWHHPGDLCRIDRDGRLWLAGRADAMMSLAGINIHPAEIEAVLEAHPAVRTAFAYGRRSETIGDIPVVEVELQRGCSATEAELLAMLRQALGVRSPREVLIVDALTRNAAGKVVRRNVDDSFPPR